MRVNKKKKTEREREQQDGKIRAQQDEFERDSRSCAAQVRALQQAWRRCPTASLCLSLSLSLSFSHFGDLGVSEKSMRLSRSSKPKQCCEVKKWMMASIKWLSLVYKLNK